MPREALGLSSIRLSSTPRTPAIDSPLGAALQTNSYALPEIWQRDEVARLDCRSSSAEMQKLFGGNAQNDPSFVAFLEWAGRSTGWRLGSVCGPIAAVPQWFAILPLTGAKRTSRKFLGDQSERL